MPADARQGRVALLAKILPEWSRVELRDHFSRAAAQPLTKARRVATAAVRRDTLHLLASVEALNRMARKRLALELAREPDELLLHINEDKVVAEENRLDDNLRFLARIVKATEWSAQRGRPGQPRNVIAYLVLSDLAAMYEYTVGYEATREVVRSGGERGQETGSFFKFAAAVWPVVFEAGDTGLAAAMKTWAAGKRQFAERSPVVANMAMRCPAWGLFD